MKVSSFAYKRLKFVLIIFQVAPNIFPTFDCRAGFLSSSSLMCCGGVVGQIQEKFAIPPPRLPLPPHQSGRVSRWCVIKDLIFQKNKNWKMARLQAGHFLRFFMFWKMNLFLPPPRYRHMHMYTYMYICAYVYVHMYICICTYVHMYMYICTYYNVTPIPSERCAWLCRCR